MSLLDAVGHMAIRMSYLSERGLRLSETVGVGSVDHKLVVGSLSDEVADHFKPPAGC